MALHVVFLVCTILEYEIVFCGLVLVCCANNRIKSDLDSGHHLISQLPAVVNCHAVQTSPLLSIKGGPGTRNLD
jgi:hypothetical protein